MAAEAISLTFFESVLKGLHKSPQIITDPSHISEPGVISVSDVSCLVIPDGCMGCVPRSVEKERRPPLRHQSIRSGGNLRVFENLAQTLVAVDAS